MVRPLKTSLNTLCFVVLVVHWSGSHGRLAVDFSGIRDPILQEKAQQYSVGALFDTHSTSIFKVKMSPQSVKDLGISFNEFSRTPHNLRTPADRINFVETVLHNVSRSLLPEGKDFLRSMLLGPLQSTVVTLSPTDEDFTELLRFLHAYRDFWNIIGRETVPKIENLEHESLTKNDFDVLSKLMRSDFEASVRDTRDARAGRDLAPMAASESNLRHLLTTVFNVPRNVVADKGNADVIRTYVRSKFESYGLVVAEHAFANYETDIMFGDRLTGTNIVGILPGKNFKTGRDTPVVLGAHIDTVVGSPGMDDNGSGMAALLEAARMITSLDCAFDNSIIFVAFDLEELGTQGSMMFVKDFVPRLLEDQLGAKSLRGALILDCIANWDDKPFTQDIPDNWGDINPKFAEAIEAANYTGDFISLVYRKGVDGAVARRFASYYTRSHSPQFRIEHMGVDSLAARKPSAATLSQHFDMLRSDHSRFWYTDTDKGFGPSTIPAVLVTDTGPYRGRLRKCYHSPCDVHVPGNEADVRFLAKTTEATAWTLADMAQGRCGPRGILSVPQMFVLLEKLLMVSPKDGQGTRDDSTFSTPFPDNTKNSVAPSAGIHNLNSIANALEMLHFLGVVPSLQEMTKDDKSDRLTNAIRMAKSLNNDLKGKQLLSTSPKSTRSTIDLFTEETTSEPNG